MALDPSLNPRSRELDWLARVRDVCHMLAAGHTPSQLIELIVTSALQLTQAERGYMVQVQRTEQGNYRAKIRYAKGFSEGVLSGVVGQVSRRVVGRVLDSRQAILAADSQHQDVLDISSVSHSRVTAIACVPMFLRGVAKGVLYLDHSLPKSPFLPSDLEYLQIFADQAALALETAELEPDATEFVARSRGEFVAGALSMFAPLAQIEAAARTWDPVLLVGEPGTGKSTVAREIHARSALCGEPFVEAVTGFAGLGSGTLHIPEVADLSPADQLELVSVLQAVRTGARSPLRVIAGTQHDPAELAGGGMRQELFYRLDVVRLELPPLRARKEDLKPLVACLAARRGGIAKLTAHAWTLMQAYTWPGNLHELQNEVTRLQARPERTPITGPELSPAIQEGKGVASAGGRTLPEVEEAMVRAAFAACKGNKSRTARQLGIPRTTLYGLMERYGLG